MVKELILLKHKYNVETLQTYLNELNVDNKMAPHRVSLKGWLDEERDMIGGNKPFEAYLDLNNPINSGTDLEVEVTEKNSKNADFPELRGPDQ